MNMREAARLRQVIRRLCLEAGGWYEQPTIAGVDASGGQPFAYLRRKDWRHWWVLSETAVLAEAGAGPFWTTGILWDSPLVLHYAKSRGVA